MSQLLLVTQRRSSSGLPVYLEEEFSSQGWTPSMIDWCASRIATLGSFIRSVQPTKQRWHDKRERTGFYSVAAWERNTAHNGRLLERALQPGGKVLQIGGLYAPHPRFRQLEYYLFFTYTMKLAFADGISPWVPPMNERRAFVERETELYRHARHIFVSASFVKEHLVAEYRIAPDRVTVVGMGVNDFYLANARPPVSETRRHCLFAGFTWELKGGPDVLRAFALAREQIPDLRLTIAGPAPRPEMNAPGVTVLGPVRDRQAMLELYRSADLFVLPSRCDSFGFVFLEAMTQGLPCIGSTMNAMPEIIGPGVSGYTVQPGDVAALAQTIVEFYRQPSASRQQLGERALARVREHYTWRTTVRTMSRVMHEGSVSPALSIDAAAQPRLPFAPDTIAPPR
jgi:glycosyltransferase involved in cell wall biosynthesis